MVLPELGHLLWRNRANHVLRPYQGGTHFFTARFRLELLQHTYVKYSAKRTPISFRIAHS
jgi:hypothetical protein